MNSLSALCIFLAIWSCHSQDLPQISDEVRDLVIDWAPLIWIHGSDPFYPSSVQFHLSNIEIRDDNETVILQNVTRSNIPTGDRTYSYHMNSVPDLNCPDCYLPWFGGQDLETAPVYAYVREYDDPCHTIDVAYRAFYPFNYGKDTCIGPLIGGECSTNIYQVYGNHVGDWEHYSIRFLDFEINSAVIDYHGFSASYIWNDTAGAFSFVNGTSSLFVNGDYPEFINLYEGNHAEVFSANGSHGMWAGEGDFEYIGAPGFSLVDVCRRDEPWETWRNIEIIPYQEDFEYTGEYAYIGYLGRWGNSEDGCGGSSVTGECILTNGPRHSPPWPTDEFAENCS